MARSLQIVRDLHAATVSYCSSSAARLRSVRYQYEWAESLASAADRLEPRTLFKVLEYAVQASSRGHPALNSGMPHRVPNAILLVIILG